jgi:hypothetical protein
LRVVLDLYLLLVRQSGQVYPVEVVLVLGYLLGVEPEGGQVGRLLVLVLELDQELELLGGGVCGRGGQGSYVQVVVVVGLGSKGQVATSVRALLYSNTLKLVLLSPALLDPELELGRRLGDLHVPDRYLLLENDDLDRVPPHALVCQEHSVLLLVQSQRRLVPALEQSDLEPQLVDPSELDLDVLHQKPKR